MFLILKSFRSRDLACTNEKKSKSTEGASNSEAGVMLPQKILQFYVISMKFLSLRCRRSSWWDVPSDEDRGDSAVFTGWEKWKLPLTEANLYLFFFHSRRKLRENVHKCLTLLPSIFMTGVHPPSPHPKFPKWQRTETSLESRRRVTNWVTFNLYKMKPHFNFSSSQLSEREIWNVPSVQSQSNLNFSGSPLR